MKPTQLRALLPTLAFAAVAACSGSGDVCSQMASFSSKNSACLTASSTLPAQSTCESELSKCSSADQTTLNSFATCLNNAPACSSPAQEQSFSLTVLTCFAPLCGLSHACQTAIGLTGFNCGNTNGGTTGNGNGSSTGNGNGTTGNGNGTTGNGNGSTGNGNSASAGGSSNGGNGSSSGTSAGNGGSSNGGSSGTNAGSTGGVGGSSSSGGSSGGSTGGPTVGSACTLTSTSSPGGTGDPCVASNLACNAPYTQGTAAGSVNGTCQLPTEYEGCAASPGCAQTPVAYTCLAGVFSSGALCVQKCTSPSTCNNYTDTCDTLPGQTTKYCLTNFCGPGSGGPNFNGLGATVADNGALYGACTVSASGDGYCIPYEFQISATATQTLGICSPTGSAATNTSCTTDRPPSGTASLCASGDYCQISLAATTPTDQGYCTAVCAAVALDGGTAPACSNVCLGNGIPNADWGLCLAACNPSASPSTCAAPDSTCYKLTGPDGGPAGACGP
ncbi:MAG: hypothetical protein ACYDCL_19020 [Myxococcales bacterium]